MTVGAGPGGAGVFGDVNAAVALCRDRMADGSMSRAEVVSLAADLCGAAIDLMRMAAEAAAVAGSADTGALDHGIELADYGQQHMISAWQLLSGAKALAQATF